MKMENEIRAEADGTLEALHVEAGQVVSAGDRLCEIRTSHGES
jgi:biotin carboxyl carrier protein